MKKMISITERYDITNKLEYMVAEYLINHGRYPELILLDVFSCKQLINEKQRPYNETILTPLKFMDITIQPLEAEQEFMMLQRTDFFDILVDAEERAKITQERFHMLMNDKR